LRIDPGRSGVIAAICNWLAGIEARLYKEIPPPDVVLRLAVSVETAKQRNRNRAEAQREDEAYVECRHRQNVRWQKSGTRHVYDIDADGTLADTVRRAQEAIWQSI
jgi:thymidylate kinase